MKISTENTRTEVTRTVSQLVDMTGRTIIYSRCPAFALTTGLSCLLTAWLLLLQGSWRCSGALIAISTWMGIWQTRIVFNSPILMIRGLLVTLYREGEDASIFMLGDLKVVEGNLTTGLAVLAVALIGVALGTIVLFPDFDASMSLSLYPTQRLLFIMLGIWFSGTAISMAYLDFPRRKLLLRTPSNRSPQVIFFASRRQRNQLLFLLEALKLEAVMQKVGLGDDRSVTEDCRTDLPDSYRNGWTR
jgi:hypothetical protein